jgi:hypothetical protein
VVCVVATESRALAVMVSPTVERSSTHVVCVVATDNRALAVMVSPTVERSSMHVVCVVATDNRVLRLLLPLLRQHRSLQRPSRPLALVPRAFKATCKVEARSVALQHVGAQGSLAHQMHAVVRGVTRELMASATPSGTTTAVLANQSAFPRPEHSLPPMVSWRRAGRATRKHLHASCATRRIRAAMLRLPALKRHAQRGESSASRGTTLMQRWWASSSPTSAVQLGVAPVLVKVVLPAQVVRPTAVLRV